MHGPSASPLAGFKVTVAPDLPLVQLDALRLKRLLRNLLDNALRHSRSSGQPNGAAVQVDLRRQTDAVSGREALHLRVRDHGAGVPRRNCRIWPNRFSGATRVASAAPAGWGWGYTCAAWWHRRTAAACNFATRSRGWKWLSVCHCSVAYSRSVIWPRISPAGKASVWMSTYHLPASKSAACAGLSVIWPSMGLVTAPLKSTATPARRPMAAGP